MSTSVSPIPAGREDAPPTPIPVAGDSLRARTERFWLPALAILVVLGIWEIVAQINGLGIWVQYISNPIDAAKAGWNMATSGELWHNTTGSLEAFVIGFAISAAIGVPLGLLMGWSRIARELLDPPINFLNATPRLALLPVIVVWLGIGLKSTIVVVVLDAVIPVVFNAMAGVRDVDVRLVQTARSFGASKPELFRKILLPASTPAIITGIRLAVARGVLGVIVAELYVSTAGIGHLIQTYGQAFRVNQVVFLVILVAVFGQLLNLALQKFERRFESWRGV